MPGTLWCGLGDLAARYTELGPRATLDRCCRAHDLCPAKLKPFASRAGLDNPSFYTKLGISDFTSVTSIFCRSHCLCEERFHSCLVAANTTAAASLGNFYFNLLNLHCVDTSSNGTEGQLQYFPNQFVF